jgi:hypothetical protein
MTFSKESRRAADPLPRRVRLGVLQDSLVSQDVEGRFVRSEDILMSNSEDDGGVVPAAVEMLDAHSNDDRLAGSTV